MLSVPTDVGHMLTNAAPPGRVPILSPVGSTPSLCSLPADSHRRSDILRDEQFDSWRLRKVVAVADDIYGVPGRTLSRICRAMRDQGMTVPTLSDEWRRHFPGRGEDRTALA